MGTEIRRRSIDASEQYPAKAAWVVIYEKMHRVGRFLLHGAAREEHVRLVRLRSRHLRRLSVQRSAATRNRREGYGISNSLQDGAGRERAADLAFAD